MGPSVVFVPEVSLAFTASGEGGDPLVQMLQFLSVSQLEVPFLSWNQTQGNQTPWKAQASGVIHCLPRLWLEEPG